MSIQSNRMKAIQDLPKPLNNDNNKIYIKEYNKLMEKIDKSNIKINQKNTKKIAKDIILPLIDNDISTIKINGLINFFEYINLKHPHLTLSFHEAAMLFFDKQEKWLNDLRKDPDWNPRWIDNSLTDLATAKSEFTKRCKNIIESKGKEISPYTQSTDEQIKDDENNAKYESNIDKLAEAYDEHYNEFLKEFNNSKIKRTIDGLDHGAVVAFNFIDKNIYSWLSSSFCEFYDYIRSKDPFLASVFYEGVNRFYGNEESKIDNFKNSPWSNYGNPDEKHKAWLEKHYDYIHKEIKEFTDHCQNRYESDIEQITQSKITKSSR